MALIDPEKAEKIEAKVTREYLKAFPELEGKYSFHLCESADGVVMLTQLMKDTILLEHHLHSDMLFV